MKNFYVLVFFFLFSIPTSFSQKTLSDYSYVVVSEQFSFQNEKDKYQLNSFTKFLFNLKNSPRLASVVKRKV